MKRLCTPLLGFVLLALAGTAAARSINDGLGTTSFPWLKAASDAEISAAGETMAARDGTAGMLVHPASVAGIERGAVKLSYVSHYVDTQYGTVGYANRFGNRCMGLRLTYVNYGEFVGTNATGERTGTFTAGDMGISLNIGKQAREDLKLGATVSYLTSKIADFTAQAATLDLGAIYTPPFEGLTVGAMLMNLGKVFKGYSDANAVKLPVYLTVGARKTLPHSPFTLLADVTFPNDNDMVYAFGVEANLNDRLFLFAGTRSRSDVDLQIQKSKTDFAAIRTFGIGLALDRYRFNYAYCPNEDLEAVHKVTIGFQTGRKKIVETVKVETRAPAPTPAPATAPAPAPAPAPVPAPPAPTPPPPEPSKKAEEPPQPPGDLTFASIYFDSEKFNIRDDQVGRLNGNAELLIRWKNISVRLEGNSDAFGAKEYNLTVGQRRADAVKRFLVDHGVSESRISTISYGEERPVDPGHNNEAWAKNRRVDFIITGR